MTSPDPPTPTVPATPLTPTAPVAPLTPTVSAGTEAWAGQAQERATGPGAGSAAPGGPFAPTRAPSWRAAVVAVAAVVAIVVMLYVVGGVGFSLVNRRPAGAPAASGPIRPPSSRDATGAIPGTSPAATSPAVTPAATMAGGSTGTVASSTSPRTGSATPTCEQPGDLRRLEGVRAHGKAKLDETFPGVGHVSYAAENLVDGDTSTAWVEGAPGLGIGSTVRLTFPRTVDVRLGCIVNGYGKSWDVYRRNARVRDLEIVSDAGNESTVLADAGSAAAPAVFQEFRVPTGAVDHVDLVIGSAYVAQSIAGKPAYDDTCVSELEFWYVPG